MHDEDKQRKRVIEWCEHANSRIDNIEMTLLKMHSRICKINLQQSVTDRMRRWTWNAKEMEQKWKNTTK